MEGSSLVSVNQTIDVPAGPREENYVGIIVMYTVSPKSTHTFTTESSILKRKCILTNTAFISIPSCVYIFWDTLYLSVKLSLRLTQAGTCIMSLLVEVSLLVLHCGAVLSELAALRQRMTPKRCFEMTVRPSLLALTYYK